MAAAAAALLGLLAMPADAATLIHAGRVIDGLSDRVAERQTIVVDAGRISAIEPGFRAPGAGDRVIDLAAGTVMPGLMDMHVHITSQNSRTSELDRFKKGPADIAIDGVVYAQRTLLAGFTTVRNVGVYSAWGDRTLRDAVNRGEVAGPRMQVAGYYLTVPGGGGDLLIPGVPEADIPARLRQGVARGPDEFRARAQAAVAGGADVLKVIASGAVLAYGGVPGEPEMTPDEIAAVTSVAHAAGLRVAAHAHGARSIKEAILAGADTIEHASLIDDEGIALAKARGVALSMDVYNGDYIDTEGRRQGWPEEFLRKNAETTEAQRQGFTRAHAAGVAIVYGTDAGVYPHGLNARQFKVMVECGMTPMGAIKSATSVAAHAMGWSDKVGDLTPGRYGDVIAVKGDPLSDVRRLQDVAVVVKGGVIFKRRIFEVRYPR